MAHKIKAVDISRNTKLGAMPATWSTISTCPPSCELQYPPPGKKAAPCYWFGGYHSRMNAQRLEEATQYLDPAAFVSWIGTLPKGTVWRDRVGGDQIPVTGDSERIDRKQFNSVARANKRRKLRGFGFTHYNLWDAVNRNIILDAYPKGYVINASTNTATDAIALKLKHPRLSVVTVLPAKWARKVYTHPSGLRVVMCPNAWDKTITCLRCQLCAEPEREVIIGFPAHGIGAAAADLIATVNL